MLSVSDLLIRRGSEMISARLWPRENPDLIHGWLGLAIVILTGFGFGFAIFWVDYTCTHVIATLAAVEMPSAHAYIRLDGEGDSPNDDVENTKPITRGLRSAIRHLRARGGGGILSTFRGFRMYLAFTMFTMGVGFVFPAAFIAMRIEAVIGSILGQFVASMLSATWQMAWVHLVIADKSPRTSYRRKLGLQHWPRIAPAAALYNFSMCMTFSLPTYAVRLADWTAMGTVGYNRGLVQILQILLFGVLPALFLLLVTLPARAVFVRVAASMLPEEDDPIVPFDRVFGGKVRANGELGLMDAWKTFDWASRKRYVMIILKALAIEVALGVVGILLVMGELAVVS
ncbi:hypothetical protein BDV10DRAFT_198951 [Aspergillus recurvatus]